MDKYGKGFKGNVGEDHSDDDRDSAKGDAGANIYRISLILDMTQIWDF